VRCFRGKEEKNGFDKKFIEHKTENLAGDHVKEPEVENHFHEY
jgi:hypothetical protein